MAAGNWLTVLTTLKQHPGIQSWEVPTATVPEALTVLSEAYPLSEFDYTAVLTLTDAMLQLERRYDLIACSVPFNNGQFYDFLRMAKAYVDARDTPFFVHFTGFESIYHYISQSVEIASKALGAAEVVLIYQWRRKFGNASAIQKYRDMIYKYVNR